MFSRISLDVLPTLVRVELRRTLPLIGRIAAATLALGLVFVAAGKGRPENLAAVLIGSCLGYVLSAPMGITRDKMEGTLEFLKALPVSPETLAASRFTAAAGALLLGALQVTVAYAMFVLPQIPSPSTSGTLVLVFLSSWLGLCTFSWLLLAVTARFDMQDLVGVPVVLLGIALLVLPIALDRLVTREIAEASLVWLFSRPWTLLVAALAGTGVVLALDAGLFRVTAAAINRYQRRADRMVL